MGLEPLLIPIGFVALLFGAKWLVDGASRLSISLGVRPFVIGITIVAFGSSAPEAALAVSAVEAGTGEIVLGNIIGSNIANIGLVLGIAAMICPVVIIYSTLRKEVWAMVAVVVLITILALDGGYSLLDGMFLILLNVTFVLLLYRSLMLRPPPEKVRVDFGKAIPYKYDRLVNLVSILVGLAVLLVGAQLIVDGSIELAAMLKVDELTIGLLLLALGTSLPELSITVTAACRKENDLLISNVLGSNIFNSLFVVGLAASMRPIDVPSAMLWFEFPMMVALSVLLLIMIRSRSMLERKEAMALLILYALYVVAVLVL